MSEFSILITVNVNDDDDEYLAICKARLTAAIVRECESSLWQVVISEPPEENCDELIEAMNTGIKKVEEWAEDWGRVAQAIMDQRNVKTSA